MVRRCQLARLELFRAGAGLDHLCVAPGACDEVYDHAPVFLDDDELSRLAVIVGIAHVDVELVLAAGMPLRADHLEGLLLGDRVPGHVGQDLLRFDRQQLSAGRGLFLLQRQLEFGEHALCVDRALVL